KGAVATRCTCFSCPMVRPRGASAAPRPTTPGPEMTTDSTPTLVMKGISRSFGAVQALKDVDFSVDSGEVMALVGDNGAGKSTLVKCLAGIYPIDDGEVLFEGRKVSINSPKDAA